MSGTEPLANTGTVQYIQEKTKCTKNGNIYGSFSVVLLLENDACTFQCIIPECVSQFFCLAGAL
jgi:hypothetical protein